MLTKLLNVSLTEGVELYKRMEICTKSSTTLFSVADTRQGICTMEAEVWKKPESAGKAGRYISVTNGAKAVIAERVTSK